MSEFWSVVQTWIARFVHNASEPLRHVTWETGALLVLATVALASVGAWVMAYSWRFRKPTLTGAKVKPAAHTYEDHIRLSSEDYLAFHKLAPTLKREDALYEKRLRDDAGRYYVVTVVEAKRNVVIFQREMRLNVPFGNRWKNQPGVIQLDTSGVTEVRRLNGYEEDDDLNSGVIVGDYNVYIRPVRWYHVRHWLTHPNREIRIVVWVTIITTSVPLLIEIISTAIG